MNATSLQPVRILWGIVFPWRDDAKESMRSLLLRWCLHLAFWTGLVAALWLLNRSARVEVLLHSPWPMLHGVWLPMLALTIYALGWLGHGLWSALQKAQSGVAPVLADAWTELGANVENIAERPVYLLLGPASAEMQGMIEQFGATALKAGPFRALTQGDAIVLAGVPIEETAELLTHARNDRAPLQGIVMSVPFAALKSEAKTRSAIRACKEELAAVRATTGVETPIHLTIVGLDTPAGWVQRFPPLPDLDPAEIVSMYQDGIEAIWREEIPRWLTTQLRLDPASPSAMIRDNAAHFRRQSSLRGWGERLTKLLLDSTRHDFAEPGMVAGCYSLPTEAKDAGPLIEDLWANLREHQNVAIPV